MINTIWRDNKWYRYFTLLVIISTVSGIYVAYKIISASPYFAFISAFIILWIGLILPLWLMWTLILIVACLRKSALLLNNIDSIEITADMLRTVEVDFNKSLNVQTYIWLAIVIPMFVYGNYIQSLNNHDNSIMGGVFLATLIWLPFLILKKIDLRKKPNTNEFKKRYLSVESARRYSIVLSIVIPIFFFLWQIHILIAAFIFWVFL